MKFDPQPGACSNETSVKMKDFWSGGASSMLPPEDPPLVKVIPVRLLTSLIMRQFRIKATSA